MDQVRRKYPNETKEKGKPTEIYNEDYGNESPLKIILMTAATQKKLEQIRIT